MIDIATSRQILETLYRKSGKLLTSLTPLWMKFFSEREKAEDEIEHGKEKDRPQLLFELVFRLISSSYKTSAYSSWNCWHVSQKK